MFQTRPVFLMLFGQNKALFGQLFFLTKQQISQKTTEYILHNLFQLILSQNSNNKTCNL
jgi:hypothetical protein